MATQFIDNNTNFESLDNWNGFDGITTSDSFSCLHLSQTSANYTEYIELQENTTYTLWCEIKTTYTQYAYTNRGLLFDSYIVDSNGNEIDDSGIDSWSIVSNSTLDAGEWRVIELRINTIEFDEDSDYSSVMLRPKFLFTDDETNGIDIYIKNVSLEDSDRRYFGENLLEDTVTLSSDMFNVGTLENTGYRYYGGYIYQTTSSLTDGIYCMLDDLLAKKILRYGDLLKFSIYAKSTLEETIDTSFAFSPFGLYESTILNNVWQRIEIEFTWSSAYENQVSNGIALYLRSTSGLTSSDTIYYALPMLEILGDNSDKTDAQWIPNSNDEIYSEYMKSLIVSYGRGEKDLSVYLYKDGETSYVDLTEKITSYKEDDSSSSTDSFTLGSIGSKNISMTVINYDDDGNALLPKDLTNYYIDVHKSYENIYDDSGNIYVDEEQFRIYENPETFSNTMSLEFQDRMAELSTSYDSKLYYPDITEDEEETEDESEEETEKTNINNIFSQLNYLSKAQGGATIINNSDGSFTISGSGTLTEDYSNIYEYNGDTASEMITEGTLILSADSVTTPYLKVSIYGVNTVYPKETEDTESEETEDEDLEEDTSEDDTEDEEEVVYETETTLLAEMSTKESNEVQLVIDETYNDNESFIIEVGFYGESGDTIIEGTIAPKLYYYTEDDTEDDTEEETEQEIIETTLPTGEVGTWEVVLKYQDGTIISSTLMQSPTIKEQLEEIATSSNMEIDYSDIDESVLNEYISFYDSTYSKRQYLGWIAEKSSCNVFVRGNTIIFEKIDINDLKEQYIDYFSNDMYVGDTFLIGRVCFDDGLEYYNKSIDLLDNDSGLYQLTASEDLETLSLSLDTGHVVTLTSGNKYTFEFESNQNIGYTSGTVGAILYSSDDTQYNINIWASPTVFTCEHSGDYTLIFVFIASEVGSYATFSNFYLTEGEYSYTQLLGDTTYNTYYVDTTNMYITSQTDIDNIYEDLYKLEITGITGAKSIIGNANVRSTDLLKLRFIDELEYKDEKNVPLVTYIAKHELTYSAEYSSSYECPVKSSNSENAESTTEESGTNTRIRKLSVSIDKTNLEMTVLAQQQTDLETKQSQFKLSLDQISLTVSSLSDYSQENYSSLSELTSQVSSAFEGIDLINKEISNFVTTSDLTSAIEESEGNIKLYVSSNYTSTVTLSETVTEITTTISDTQSALEESISTVQTTLESTISSVQSDLEDSIATTKSDLEDEISTSATNTITTITTTLENYATTSDLTSAIEESEGNIKLYVSSNYATTTTVSTLQEQVDSVSGDVTTISNSLSSYATKTELSSSISTSETEILSTVSSNYYSSSQVDNLLTGYTTKDDVTETIESYIKISEGNIQLVVSSTTYEVYTAESTDTILDEYVKEESVISSINQSAEEVTISAEKISLEGIVTANSYFIINTDGSMECTNAIVSGTITATGGEIAGWTIGDDSIYKTTTYAVGTEYQGTTVTSALTITAEINSYDQIISFSQSAASGSYAFVSLNVESISFSSYESNKDEEPQYITEVGFGGFIYRTTDGETDLTDHLMIYSETTLNSTFVYDGYVEINKNGDAYYYSTDSSSGYKVYFGIGSGHYNRGIYDGATSQWQIYSDTNNDTIIQADRRIRLIGDTTTYVYPTSSYSTSSTGVVFAVSTTTSYTASNTSNTNIVLACGVDSTSPFLRSYATYSRTGSSAANVNVTSSGTFNRYSSSSYRYKNTINYFTNTKYASNEGLSKSDSTITYDDFRETMRSVLNVPVVQFHYNDGYMTGEPDYDYTQYEVGFIAEDIYKNVPDATQYNEDGTIEMWNVNKIVPRMLFVLQEHDVSLSEYDKRLLNLEEENLLLREKIVVLEETIEKLNA